jgi:arsenical pump membrane protein
LFAKRSNVNPIPYLVAEFMAANTWSLMFIIGNPTNIYLATSVNISFFNYFKIMVIPTLCVGFAEFLLLILIFYKKLKAPLEINNEKYKIENKPVLLIGIAHLIVCLIFLILSSYIKGLDMWIISFISASSLFVITLILCSFKKCKFQTLTNSLNKLPYQLIPFFLSMFVIVVALKEQGVSSEISKLLNKGDVIWTYGLSSFASSNLINNIPMSILFTDLCSNVGSANYLKAIYSSIIGSNLGAFLTPMGALAGIMFTNLVNKQGVKYTFADFIKYGVVISIPLIIIALCMLNVVFTF